MTSDQDLPQEPFRLGESPGWTPEDLAKFEKRLREAQAHLEEVSANVDTPPALHHDPRHRTLPEAFAQYEERLREAEACLAEAAAEKQVREVALDRAASASSGERARLEEELEAATTRVEAAEEDVNTARLFVDRANLPEDEEAEAHARVARAEMLVEFAQMAVVDARSDLLPDHCREALRLLAEYATDVWLDLYGSSDERRRAVVRPQVLSNIEGQIANTMFRPRLGGLDKAINITGDPEPPPPRSGSSRAPRSEQEAAANELADSLNRLRHDTGESPESPA